MLDGNFFKRHFIHSAGGGNGMINFSQTKKYDHFSTSKAKKKKYDHFSTTKKMYDHLSTSKAKKKSMIIYPQKMYDHLPTAKAKEKKYDHLPTKESMITYPLQKFCLRHYSSFGTQKNRATFFLKKLLPI